ncbi:MAG: hypothetical protein KF718_03215 [Polyangiaceae bacterium]|nr:hypothetical protein [Polyangiaceae bacterium]
MRGLIQLRAALLFTALAFLSLLPGCLGCCSGCPTSTQADVRSFWEQELLARRELPLRPAHEIAIKRDVHEIFVSADAASFANAFHEVMRDTDRRFGLIRVDRLTRNQGKPFSLGEKFQGRYQLEEAVKKELGPRLRRWFGELVDDDEVRDFLCRIENEQTSDYGIISRLELSPPPGQPYVLEYRYLDGSPIAGSSTFIVSEASAAELQRLGVPKAAKLTQIFVYQEQSGSFAKFFTRGGLKMHDQVVMSQASQSAKLAGAEILTSTIPKEYF